MAGYVRQAAASIAPSIGIASSPLNTEFNAIQAAFAAGSGHSHSGAVGEGQQIDYSSLLNKPTIISLTSSAPADLGASASVGVATTAAKGDHVHKRPTLGELGAAASGHTHADATTSVSGFMSAASVTKLNGIAAGAQPGTVTSITPNTGFVAGSPITTTGTLNIDPAVVAFLSGGSNNWGNNVQSNLGFKGESFVVTALGSKSGAFNADLSLGSFFTVTIGSSGGVLTFTNPKSGRGHVAYVLVTFTASGTFAITNDRTKGSPAPFVWTSTTDNTQSWSTSGVDLLQCITFDGGTNWYVVRLATNPT